MNLSDVIVRVQRQFGDESGVQITSDDVTRWANDAQRDIVLRNESVLQTTGTANSVANQQAYAFPQNLLVLRSIHYKREDGDLAFYKLKGMSYTEFDEYIDGWEGTAYGPSYPIVYTTYADQILLFPIPVSSGTNNIKIVYSREPTELTSDVDQIDLPLPYHNAVVDYCLAKAYQLDEDWNAAGVLSNEYNASVNLNRERENWNNHEVYPRITTNIEDFW
jgi:hypothetical protein